jgi:hypothetical protein
MSDFGFLGCKALCSCRLIDPSIVSAERADSFFRDEVHLALQPRTATWTTYILMTFQGNC